MIIVWWFMKIPKQKLKLFHDDGELKDLPTKIHINMIMWAYSPFPDILKNRKALLKNKN